MRFDASHIDTIQLLPVGPSGYRSRLRRLCDWLLPCCSFETAVTRLLDATRARVDRPEKWCRGHYTDGTGAVCLVTALRRAGEWADANALICAIAALQAVAHHLGFSTIELMNDGLDHPRLLAAIDEAATPFLLARSQGPTVRRTDAVEWSQPRSPRPPLPAWVD
jgi:hypothetical protein